MRMTIQQDNVWPPSGWTTLGEIKTLRGRSLVKEAQSARVRGLTYRISSDPLYVMEQRYYIHRIHVDGWEYTIQNDSNEFPVLSLKIMDRFDDHIPEEFYVSDIKAMACPVDLSERSVRRTIQLLRFLIGQIDKGYVPDVEKMLRMYRLHPLQLYVREEGGGKGVAWPCSLYGIKSGNDQDCPS